MTFTTSKLTNQRVLVKGTDVLGTTGSTVVSSAQWDEINSLTDFKAATADFDATVEAFFAPIMEAAEKLGQARQGDKPDEVSYIVLEEATEGVKAQPAHVVELTRDSQVLRLIESGETSRLVWVDGSLEILAAETNDTPAPAEVAEVNAEA